MKYKLIIISALCLCFAFVGCKPSSTGKSDVLSVTIDPQKYFLTTIIGDHYAVNCVVPSGGNPENADFTPSQMMAVNKSTAYFKIGYLGIENTLIEKVAESNPDMKIIDCSQGIKLIGDPHIHDYDHGNHDHGHDHDANNAHANGDPHIWSSVTSAKTIAANMYNAMLQLDKENEADYTLNYNKLLVEFNQTDSIVKSYLEKAPSKAFIIYHPALSYFAEEYGLTQYSIEYEGKNPSPSLLKQLIDKAKEEGVKVIFIQQEFDTKNAETIAKAVGGKTIPINLLSYQWSDEMIKIAKALAQEYE